MSKPADIAEIIVTALDSTPPMCHAQGVGPGIKGAKHGVTAAPELWLAKRGVHFPPRR